MRSRCSASRSPRASPAAASAFPGRMARPGFPSVRKGPRAKEPCMSMRRDRSANGGSTRRCSRTPKQASESRCDNVAGATGARERDPLGARPFPLSSFRLEPRMRLFLPSIALALLLAGCDEPVEDASAATVTGAQTAAAEAQPRLIVSRRAAPAASAGSAAAAVDAASPPRMPARAPAAMAEVERATGGPGPRRRIVEPDPPFVRSTVASFNQPWAMTFLPDGRALVTEKGGALRLVDVANGQAGTVSGVPAVAVGGQGGLGDVILHPRFASNRRIYLSYIERSGAIYGAVVVHARLET